MNIIESLFKIELTVDSELNLNEALQEISHSTSYSIL